MVQTLFGWIPELIVAYPIPAGVVIFAASFLMIRTAGDSDPRVS